MTKIEIRVPMPGIFYRRPAPESPPFKSDGDGVAANDVVGLVEVMKNFHEIKSASAGSSIRYLVEDADAVMAGQVVAEIEG